MKDYICVRCPAKAHFIGEHSVVYYKPAIIAAISMYSNVYARKSDQVVISDVKNLEVEGSFSIENIKDFISYANGLWKKCNDKKDFKEMEYFFKKDKMNLPKAWVGKTLEQLNIESGIDIKIDSGIPSGAGLGSSASLSVGIPAAVSEVYNKQLPLNEINEIASEIEKFNHGTPSGGDNSTCCYGGLIWFKRYPESPTKPKIEQIRDEVPYKLENFVLIQTGGEGRSTRGMIDKIRGLEPDYRNSRIETLGNATYEMREVLRRGDFGTMEKLMNFAHRNLAELGVSTDEMDFVHEKVKESGGSIKLSGAGGPKSCMIGHHQQKDKLTNLLEDLGYKPWEVELGVNGVRIEKF